MVIVLFEHTPVILYLNEFPAMYTGVPFRYHPPTYSCLHRVQKSANLEQKFAKVRHRLHTLTALARRVRFDDPSNRVKYEPKGDAERERGGSRDEKIRRKSLHGRVRARRKVDG